MSKSKNLRSIGDKLRAKRLELQFTQSQVSEELGFTSPQFISRLERGEVGLPIKYVPMISHMFQVPNTKLLEWILDDYERICMAKIESLKK